MNSEVGTLRPEVLGKLGNTESNNCEKDLSHTGEIDDKLFKKKKNSHLKYFITHILFV